MKTPMRTCLVSGEILPQKELLRFTLQQGKVVFDEKIPQSGRGGYIKNDPKIKETLQNNPRLKGKICHFMKVKKVEF